MVFDRWSIEFDASRDEQIFVREIERGYASILRQAPRARKLIISRWNTFCSLDFGDFYRWKLSLPIESCEFFHRHRIFYRTMLAISGMKAQQDIVSQLGPDLASRRKLRYNTFLRPFVIFVFRYRSINRKLYEVFGSFYARKTSISFSIKLKV